MVYIDLLKKASKDPLALVNLERKRTLNGDLERYE
jgi:hypothetical protein